MLYTGSFRVGEEIWQSRRIKWRPSLQRIPAQAAPQRRAASIWSQLQELLKTVDSQWEEDCLTSEIIINVIRTLDLVGTRNIRVLTSLSGAFNSCNVWNGGTTFWHYFWKQQYHHRLEVYIMKIWFLILSSIIPKSCRLNSIGETLGPSNRTSIDLMNRVIPALLASRLITNNPRNMVQCWSTKYLRQTGWWLGPLCYVKSVRTLRDEMMKSYFLCLTNREEEGPGTVEV